MTEEEFNIELQSIKNDVADLLKVTNKLIYRMLLRILTPITFKNASNEVRSLFYFLIDSYDGEKSINDRLIALFSPFRIIKKKKKGQ